MIQIRTTIVYFHPGANDDGFHWLPSLGFWYVVEVGCQCGTMALRGVVRPAKYKPHIVLDDVYAPLVKKGVIPFAVQ